jgi:hypothetical protein
LPLHTVVLRAHLPPLEERVGATEQIGKLAMGPFRTERFLEPYLGLGEIITMAVNMEPSPAVAGVITEQEITSAAEVAACLAQWGVCVMQVVPRGAAVLLGVMALTAALLLPQTPAVAVVGMAQAALVIVW